MGTRNPVARAIALSYLAIVAATLVMHAVAVRGSEAVLSVPALFFGIITLPWSAVAVYAPNDAVMNVVAIAGVLANAALIYRLCAGHWPFRRARRSDSAL